MKPRINVLIIDDDRSIGQSIKRNLELNHAMNVHLAFNGKDGIALAREKLPDIVLLDVMMPGMPGGEVAEALREETGTCGIPVIFLTGLLNKAEAKGRRGALGGERYLAKPASIEEIVTAIRCELVEKGQCKAPSPFDED